MISLSDWSTNTQRTADSVFRYFNLVGELCEHSYGERETDDKSNNLLGVKHCKITASTISNLGQFGN